MCRIVHLESTIGSRVYLLERRNARLRAVLPSGPAVQPEPVSPELVLIDPELARRERARLEERAYLQSVLEHSAASPTPVQQVAPAPVATDLPRVATWRDAATFARRRLVPAALLCSLLANGFLVADLVTRKGQEAAQVAVRMVTLTEGAAQAPSTSTTSRVTTIAGPATKRAVESKVVSLILSAPARKLPRDFVDPTTGLVKNNVHVVCKKRQQRSFLCAIRLPSPTAGKALFVRYRMSNDGHDIFHWDGYKRTEKIVFSRLP
jgi:hypothetical protein